MTDPHKYVYSFGGGTAEGKADMKALLGGKGANLAEMSVIGIPVPPGFTITTEVCAAYYENGKKIPEAVTPQVEAAIRAMEERFGAKLGDPENPLLVSVRSGAALSMPGMMNTILNLGLSDASVEGLAKKTGNPRFAYDGYRRLIDMFGSVVMGVDHEHFEHELASLKAKRGVKLDTELSGDDLKELVARYKDVYKAHTKADFPQDPIEQLWAAIKAVFASWEGKKAIEYRRIERITGLKGTAVNVQAMVFGNMGENSGTGVAFTRDPNTGENVFYGDYLINAQGEDVVAGIRTPEPISRLADDMPKVYEQLMGIRQKLETHYKEMQDIEFTVQDGTLYMLQTRTGKRTGTAAVRIAVEMVGEGLIDERTAIQRVNPDSLNHLLLPQLDPKAEIKPVARGIAASPGAASGKVVLSAEAAVAPGRAVPGRADHAGPQGDQPRGRGGDGQGPGHPHRHRRQGQPRRGRRPRLGQALRRRLRRHPDRREGGDRHAQRPGRQGGRLPHHQRHDRRRDDRPRPPTVDPEMTGDFATLMGWADKVRTLKVRTNADTPAGRRQGPRASAPRGSGSAGPSTCSSSGQRIVDMRKMILADDEAGRKAALEALEPYPAGGLRRHLRGDGRAPRDHPPARPAAPRVPAARRGGPGGSRPAARHPGREGQAAGRRSSTRPTRCSASAAAGCRSVYPEIGDMQVRAIIEAAIEVKKRGKEVLPEIMIPLVGTVEELSFLKKRTVAVAEEVMKKAGRRSST